MTVVQEWVDWYYRVEKQYQDPRTVGWFMVGSPIEGALICLAYVFLVTLVGPRYMKNREPFNIRKIMVVYNFLMVLLSSYTVYLFLIGGWATSYTFGCQLVDTARSPEAMAMVTASYLFYLSKFIELFDTVFFLLRKKFQLITFLHVFHHAIMPASWWIGVKFSPGGMGTFHALLNSFVHVCMYTYYGISAMGPEYQKYVWWKKYMTKLQMGQFMLVMVHASQQFVTECSYPMLFAYWIFSYALIFLALFANFYIQAYLKRHQHNTVRHKSVSTNTTTTTTTTKSTLVAENGTTTCRTNGHQHQNGELNGYYGYSNGNNNYITSNGLKED